MHQFKLKCLLLFYYTTCCQLIVAQPVDNYTYRHYDTKDGLAGNNVYCAAQDKDGFIWFGTETGLSRFDGSHFKNYTVANGLPDNEIINIYADSRGRVWFVPFKKTICYYYQGKIYNAENDTVLSKIKITGSCYSIIECVNGNVIIHDSKALHIITPAGNITVIKAGEGGNPKQFNGIYKSDKLQAWVTDDSNIYQLNNNTFTKCYTKALANSATVFHNLYTYINDSLLITAENADVISVTSHSFQQFNSTRLFIPISSFPISVNLLDNIIYVSSLNGVYCFSQKNALQQKKYYIKDNIVNRVTADKEKNLWVLTKGNGVFLKRSGDVKNFQTKYDNNAFNLLSINADKKHLLLGYDKGAYSLLKKSECENSFLSKQDIIFLTAYNEPFNSPVIYTDFLDDGKMLAATAIATFVVSKGNTQIRQLPNYGSSVKSIEKTPLNYLVSTNTHLLLLNRKTLQFTDTIWNERSTCANYYNGYYYVGTLNGLYRVISKSAGQYLGDSFPIFKRRISGIKISNDGCLWVSTYDEGLVVYKNGMIIQHITDTNGLTSNICRNLFLKDNYLWVGTDKGLNKIDVSKPPYAIAVKYTTADGLASDMINAVYTDSNMIYAATPAGLTFFDETKISQNSSCNMRILGVTVSGKERQYDSAAFILKHKDNNIRFDFVALSFKSGGDITYRYRLLGLNDEWKTTKENYISYPALPSGSYQFEVEAINKFGIKSELLSVSFEIKKLLIEETWLRVTAALSLLGLIIFYFNWRINKIRKWANEKAITTAKITETEQMALRAQMNPHFIFNSLNSIQHYVIEKDVEGANRFLNKFSGLIRKTLDNASKSEISLVEEENYLDTYLQLEQLRFEDKFTYVIQIDSTLNKHTTFIPPMILQPYIENAIRHGVQNKAGNDGLIKVTIQKKGSTLYCEITDNGVGRIAAGKLKKLSHIEYQSKGISLTSERLQLLKKRYTAHDISFNIVDLIDGDNNPSGTKIIIKLPLIV
jgi:ligand-binding sensor domain-containing protein